MALALQLVNSLTRRRRGVGAPPPAENCLLLAGGASGELLLAGGASGCLLLAGS